MTTKPSDKASKTNPANMAPPAVPPAGKIASVREKRYLAGFAAHCAAQGVDPELLIAKCSEASARRVSSVKLAAAVKVALTKKAQNVDDDGMGVLGGAAAGGTAGLMLGGLYGAYKHLMPAYMAAKGDTKARLTEAWGKSKGDIIRTGLTGAGIGAAAGGAWGAARGRGPVGGAIGGGLVGGSLGTIANLLGKAPAFMQGDSKVRTQMLMDALKTWGVRGAAGGAAIGGLRGMTH